MSSVYSIRSFRDFGLGLGHVLTVSLADKPSLSVSSSVHSLQIFRALSLDNARFRNERCASVTR